MNNRKKHEMEGKICLITGGSRGIGFYTALGLAIKGAHVIIVGYDQEHCEQAIAQIKESAGDDSARYYIADLSSQEKVVQLAEKIKQDYDHLDVLVNNVGGWFKEYQESKKGIEKTFALNHLSYYLLTGLLLDPLKKSTSPRIVNVSSDAHKQVRGIRFEDIQYKEKYRAFPAYAQSKLANILFTHELKDRLEGTNVTVNALHPGFVNSELYRNYGRLTPVIKFFAKVFGKSSKEGAETSIYLASSPEVANVTGKYFVGNKQKESSPASYDKEAAQNLWQISEEMTGFSYPF